MFISGSGGSSGNWPLSTFRTYGQPWSLGSNSSGGSTASSSTSLGWGMQFWNTASSAASPFVYSPSVVTGSTSATSSAATATSNNTTNTPAAASSQAAPSSNSSASGKSSSSGKSSAPGQVVSTAVQAATSAPGQVVATVVQAATHGNSASAPGQAVAAAAQVGAHGNGNSASAPDQAVGTGLTGTPGQITSASSIGLDVLSALDSVLRQSNSASTVALGPYQTSDALAGPIASAARSRGASGAVYSVLSQIGSSGFNAGTVDVLRSYLQGQITTGLVSTFA